MYDVDRVTQSVVQAVLDAQRNGTDASPMGVPVNMVDTSTSTPSTTTPLKTPPTLYPPPNITQMELRRMRKQFLAMNKSEAVRVDAGRVSQLFVDYLNGQWGRL